MIAALRSLRAALPIVAIVALLVLLALVDRCTAQRDAARADRDAAREETVALRAEVRATAEAAARADLDNVHRVQADQDAITKKVVRDYEKELADVRARVERLRRDAATGAGGGGGATVSAPGDAAGPAATPSAEGGLPPLSDPDALIATEQALQLGALIDWVEAQSAVEVSR